MPRGMAVQVVCYELYRQLEANPVIADQWDRSPATAAQLEGLIAHFELVLTDDGDGLRLASAELEHVGGGRPDQTESGRGRFPGRPRAG